MPKVIGHEPIVKDLTTLAEKGELSHGYIFYGPSMVGKRATALALAHFLERGTFEVPTSHEVLQEAKLIDLAFAKELDKDVKDSIGIDAVREIKNFLWQKPNMSPKRTLIIDDAELLTTEAQNALLKITEEPPASSLLIVIAYDLQGVMGTIRSRLQVVHFGTVAEKAIAEWLAEGGAGAAGAAKRTDATSMAKKSLGKPGLAWKLLHDKEFNKQLEVAEIYLTSSPATRKELIKKIIDPDDFVLRNFLEAVIITLAWEKPSKAKADLWHRTLALYENASNFTLNPRLQLETLLMK